MINVLLPPSPPGDTILDLLDEKSWTQQELATRIELSTKHINDLVHGRVSITTDIASALSRVLGSTAAFWMARESNYRLALERAQQGDALEASIPWMKTFPVSWMVKQGWLAPASSKATQVEELLRFFGVRSPAAWEARYGRLGVAWRSSKKTALQPGAVSAFLRRAELVAERRTTAPWDRAAFKAALIKLRALTLEGDPKVFWPELQKRCADVGVAVVVVPHPPGCPVSGATRWLSPEKALLVLSLRHTTNDHLWFSFFHEAAHILLHSKKMEFIEGVDGLDDVLEAEADEFARDLLVPQSDFHWIKGGPKTESSIREASEKVGVAPGIIVGRLQSEELIAWSRLNHLKIRYRWPEPSTHGAGP